LEESDLPNVYKALLQKRRERTTVPIATPQMTSISAPLMPSTEPPQWTFPRAALSRSTTSYPLIASVLSSLDQGSGGACRYFHYAQLFEQGLLLRSIGEVLTFVHDEADHEGKLQQQCLLEILKQVAEPPDAPGYTQQWDEDVPTPTSLFVTIIM
jgi:hypothetical protein